jgi:hypothetical protein
MISEGRFSEYQSQCLLLWPCKEIKNDVDNNWDLTVKGNFLRVDQREDKGEKKRLLVGKKDQSTTCICTYVYMHIYVYVYIYEDIMKLIKRCF